MPINSWFDLSGILLSESICEISHYHDEELFTWCTFFEFLWRLLAKKWLSTIQKLLSCLALTTLRHVTDNVEETGYHFSSTCFFLEQLLVDLAHLRRSTKSIAVLLPTHVQRSMTRHLCRCYTQHLMNLGRIFSKFLCTSQHEPSFERLTDYAGSNTNIFLLPNVQVISCIDASHTNVHRSLNLTVYHMRILFYQFMHSIDIFWNNNRFWRSSLNAS